MTTSPGSAGPSDRERPAPDAVERLYVYWLVSTILLALVAIIAVLLVRGTLRQHARAAQELAQRVAVLEQAQPVSKVGPVAAPEPRTAVADRPPADKTPAAPQPAAPATKPTTADAAPTAPAAVAWTETEVAARLDRVMTAATKTPADVADPAQAAALVTEALAQIGRAEWSGAVWARLAVLARLVGHNSASEAFAQRAAAAGDPLLAYTEVSLRAALTRGWPQEALPLAERFVDATGGATARVLLAAALLASGEPAPADKELATMPAAAALSAPDRLLLARLLMSLERWQSMAAVLSEKGAVPAELTPEHSFLQAVALAHDGRTVEALAILEYLAGRLPPTAGEAVSASGESSSATAVRTPDRYEITVWQGETLRQAKQLDAARQALEAAARLDPGRPDAHYYLGLLERQAGRPSVAAEHLKNALASAARLAPAWEALASLEVNDGQMEAAVQHLSRAIEINNRRASAHFLLAIAYAKQGQREPAAGALGAALQLDPRLLEEAKQAEVLVRLITPGEMESMAGAPAAKPTGEPSAEPAGETSSAPASEEPPTDPLEP